MARLRPWGAWPRLTLGLGLGLLLAAGLFPETTDAGVTVTKGRKDKYKVTFRYQPVIAVSSVHLAGDFNGWRADATPMKEKAGTGRYEIELELPAGRQMYKFVLNGTTWVHDMENPEKQEDGHSGYNSVVFIGRPPTSKRGQPDDGRIDVEQLIHDPSRLSFACAVDDDRRVILRLHALAGDLRSVRVEVTPAPTGSKGDRKVKGTRRFAAAVPMRRIAELDGRDVFEARLLYPERHPESIRYRFLLSDGANLKAFGRNGLGENSPRFQLVLDHAGRFETPQWTRDAVFYQIFPDRFFNADKSNDLSGIRTLRRRPQGRAYAKEDAFVEEWDARPAYHNFFGGDLKGITAKLDVIAGLGMNTIYLNPIFRAASNHRYDAADFDAIDERLGDEADFKELCAEAKKRGIRILLDAVFNHSGRRHYAFEDLVKKGAKSKYKDWYFVDSFPIRLKPKPTYRCWWNFADLPQLNTRNPEVVDHLLGVSNKWLDAGAAGWRLDVPNEVEAVNPNFWRDFRKAVRAKHPQAYIVGEIWTDPTPWLHEEKFDATMNYPVRDAIMDFIIKKETKAEDFDARLAAQRARLPEPAARVQFNLLGSHDTARIKHIAGPEARHRIPLAFGVLFAYLGPPVVYYGDEIGMDGGKDPDCRRTYPWDHPQRHDTALRDWIQALAKARKKEPALRRGTIRSLKADGRSLAFLREPEAGDPGRAVLVVVNASDQAASIKLPPRGLPEGDLEIIVGSKGAALEARGAEGELTIKLPAQGIAYIAAGE